MRLEEAAAAIGERVVIDFPLARAREAGELVYVSSSHAFVRVDGRTEPEAILPVWLELERP